MKTQLIPKPHSILPDRTIIEVWHDGKFIATITGADGPGVRVISKHPKYVGVSYDPMICEVSIDPSKVQAG